MTNDKAAREIERLRAENGVLREALNKIGEMATDDRLNEYVYVSDEALGNVATTDKEGD